MSYLHRAWAEIDLGALKNNFNLIKNSTNSKIFSVVKADAYGHSVKEIAEALDLADTYGFAVSNIDEAKELRSFGIKRPLLILGYTPVEFANELNEYNIIQTVYSLEYALKLNESAKKENIKLSAHLKLDTGMGRIGFDCRDDSLCGLEEVKKSLSLSNLMFDGVFTHFAVADGSKKCDKDFTNKQFSRFSRAIEILKNDGFTFSLCHCCNSAATISYKDMHLDAVRPGIILYGLTPDVDMSFSDKFKPVMTFKAAVSMVKTVNSGVSVNYGRTYTAKKPTKIATVSVGYADGYPRLLSNKGYVLVKGQKANIVGRICMDQMSIDVTDIDGVSEGDIVTLFGKGLPVERVAQWANTINYEIVCGISKRVPRIHI